MTEQAQPTVFVVDDDQAMRNSLRWLIESVGLAVETYATAHEFLAAHDASRPGCLVLDIRMPGMSGLDLQTELNTRDIDLPVIFITGHGDVTTAVQALKAGAIDFIEKPFSGQTLLDRISTAIEQDARARRNRSGSASVRARLALLTPREREVLDLVVQGHPNKAIAAQLNLSQKTVECHRAHVMDKMQVRSVADLVRIVVATPAAQG